MYNENQKIGIKAQKQKPKNQKIPVSLFFGMFGKNMLAAVANGLIADLTLDQDRQRLGTFHGFSYACGGILALSYFYLDYSPTNVYLVMIPLNGVG
jgi:hypothetical protein